jgi:hypothetical protein
MTVRLGPQEVHRVAVSYDPIHVSERHSRDDAGTLAVSFAEHPLVEEIALSASVRYPNLDVPVSEVNFGAVLLDTFVTRDVVITNTSPVPVTYGWVFESSAGGGTNVHDVDQVFDVVPSSGVLEPGQSEVAQFFFHGCVDPCPPHTHTTHTHTHTHARARVHHSTDVPRYLFTRDIHSLSRLQRMLN